MTDGTDPASACRLTCSTLVNGWTGDSLSLINDVAALEVEPPRVFWPRRCWGVSAA